MIKGIFITGTDTGVGKTYVAMMIASAIKRQGIDLGVMKPSETGCHKRRGALVPADAVSLLKAAGSADRLDYVNPYRFAAPLAPAVAAKLDGKRIVPGKIHHCFQILSARHQFMIIEGAGGIMVPLTDKYTYLDLAADMGLPVLIVARPGLGTINHTLLTISALQHRKISIAGVVINYANERKPGLAEKTSPAMIEKMSGIKIAGVVRYGADAAEKLLDKIDPPWRAGGT